MLGYKVACREKLTKEVYWSFLPTKRGYYSVHNPDCLPTWLAKDFWMAAANSGFFERPVKFLSPLKRLLVSTR